MIMAMMRYGGLPHPEDMTTGQRIAVMRAMSHSDRYDPWPDD
jgi:hypothetical protein